MEKIITAIGNPELNEKLKCEKEFYIPCKDIQYKEGILEILEKNNKINSIIINEKLPGKIEIKLLINKIKEINNKIKIFLLIFDKKIIENYKEENNIFYFNNLNYELIKKQILEKQGENKSKKNNEKNENSKEEKIEIEKENETPSKCIFVFGQKNIGKTLFSLIIAMYISEIKYKVLLVDNNSDDGNLHTFLQEKKKINIIQKINNNLDFICMDDQELFKKIEKNYDFIIIDNFDLKVNSRKINKKNKIIFICESNLVGIAKGKKELEKIQNINIELKNILIILNYFDKNSIDIEIIKKFLENLV